VLSSPIIDLAIGLVFVFGVAAALASFVTELITRFIGLRGAYLLTGLRELVDDGKVKTDLSQVKNDYGFITNFVKSKTAPDAKEPAATAAISPEPGKSEKSSEKSDETEPPPVPSATGALLGGPILGSQGIVGQINGRKLTMEATSKPDRAPKIKMTANAKAGPLRRQLRSLPAYISSASFAEAIVDLVVPNSSGQTTMATIQAGIDALPPGMPLKASLVALAKNANDDSNRFRASVEQWYDDHMDRVSGWYKRHVAKITLVIGGLLVVLLNLNAVTIGRTLYSESTVSAAISTVAAKATSCSKNESPKDCLANLDGQLSAAATAGLPIGWGTVRDCTEPNAHCNLLDRHGILSRHGDSVGQVVLVLLGFAFMIIALVPGAQFWFGLLSKLGSLRDTGPKPASTS
jgi:hypothetical protein